MARIVNFGALAVKRLVQRDIHLSIYSLCVLISTRGKAYHTLCHLEFRLLPCQVKKRPTADSHESIFLF